ncbi:MAG: YqhA family protein [Chloroflexota bacterium]|nr:YqhA family protein [Chloroflexota bacterium]
MRRVFNWSRFLIFLAVVALLLATLAVFIFGLISTVLIVIEAFRHGQFNAEGARRLSVELIEMIDLFLLGTILFITAIGLQELFVDPGLKDVIPEWMSVNSLEQLKFNLLAVIVVMLAVLFLGVAASFELTEGVSILDYGAAVALVITAAGIAIYLFAKVDHMREEHEDAVEEPEEHRLPAGSEE